MTKSRHAIAVSDPFGAASDPLLPTVATALEPDAVNEAFKHGLPRLAGSDGRVTVRSIQVVRHKPGKRAVIEYRVRVKRPGAPVQRVRLFGKIRAKRFGNEAYRLLDALWQAGFNDASADGVSVPEPLGVLPEFRMWLQRRVKGSLAGPALSGPDGVAVARRIAEAIHKLHVAGVPAERSHSMDDELRILHECLARVTQLHPAWAGRIERLRESCDRLGTSVPKPQPCGIHRDFYPAQVILKGRRLWLIDFDLYCQGDPALDVGNFLGHVLEEGVRLTADATALREREKALEERFIELAGRHMLTAVRAYTTLTLARHVYLTTQFPDRVRFVEPVLNLCEQRLRDAGQW
jgi:aminoglycoside phosphotransferase (APT) family kinase protein